jgi:ArsR family transcriptional regulator
VRLAKPDFAHISVRLADMYALPLHDASYDVVLLHMVLHYAEDPAAAIAEARRVLAPGGTLAVVDFAAHDRADLSTRLAHRNRGFADDGMDRLLRDAGLAPAQAASVAGPLTVRIWTCQPIHAPAPPQPQPHFEDAL